MNFIKNNFRLVIIILLMIVIFVQRCNTDNVVPSKPIIVRDTVWQRYDSIIPGKPILIKSKPTIDIQYKPDPNYDILLKQYNDVVKKYLMQNIYSDSIKVGTFGSISVIDTISKNNIIGRSFKTSLNIPTITETITLQPKLKNQIYFGGGLQGSVLDPINQINAGFLLKTKKDNIYGVSAGINSNGQIMYGVQSYWKIKFK